MSPLAVPLVTFLFFSSLAAAQITAPGCTSYTYQWSYNSLNQNACWVAAYMMATCYDGRFEVLQPPYLGPYASQSTDLCECNTIAYSLLSACSACQGGTWVSWSEYSARCVKVLPPSTFPNPVPLDTRVPKWALIDVTSDITWDSSKAMSVGDSPEAAPGAILGSSGATVTTLGAHTITTLSAYTSTSLSLSLFSETFSTIPTYSPPPSNLNNTGPIVGGVVGVSVLSLAAVAIGVFLRRRHQGAPVVAASVATESRPPMDEIQRPLNIDDGYAGSSTPGTIGTSSLPVSPAGPMRFYDSNDPSTFPAYQGVPQTPITPPQGDALSSGNSLATMQTSQVQGYHGLPIV